MTSLAKYFDSPELRAEIGRRNERRVSSGPWLFYELVISEHELQALQRCGDFQTVMSIALRAYLSRFEQSGKMLPAPDNPRGKSDYLRGEAVRSMRWAMPLGWPSLPWQPGKYAETHFRAALREFIAKNGLLPNEVTPDMLPRRDQTVVRYFLKPWEHAVLQRLAKRPYSTISDIIYEAVGTHFDRHGHASNLFAPEGNHEGEAEFSWRMREPYAWLLPANNIGHWVSQAIRAFLYDRISWESGDQDFDPEC